MHGSHYNSKECLLIMSLNVLGKFHVKLSFGFDISCAEVEILG